ncbi:MAG: NADH-quinone oxidoreductase subunit J [Acidobacteriota bacterium]|nr:NADH-quinone oxidoreductase subunit J [Acidobacteriota bacterium]MDH3785642.1 NADH-quinone oxidoreductase subunit J [Acidobacteriota bacterium]
MEQIAFIVLSGLALISALVVVFHRNQVISALALAGNLVAIAGFYMLLNAQFLALLQVIVYAGAIMVLVLFVIMLLNVAEEARSHDSSPIQRYLSPILAIVFVVALGAALFGSGSAEPFAPASDSFGTVDQVGISLFTTFFYAFEVISLLLVVAMVGSVLLAKRRL